MKFKHLNITFLGLVLFTSSLVNNANAGLISIDNTDTEFSQGNFANLQGLEWLSLDLTLGLSRDNVESGFIGNDNDFYTYSSNASRLNNSWRYATYEETEILLNSLTYNSNYDPKWLSVDKFEAANWFHQSFGYVSKDIINYDFYHNSAFQFGLKEELINGVIASSVGNITTLDVKDGYSVGNGYQGWFPNGELGTIRTYTSKMRVDLNNSNTPTASLLVRAIKVPEPPIFTIFALGIIGLASRRFKS